MTAFVEEQQDRIAVSEEQAASGSRSLRVVDAPGLLFPYDPHFACSPLHESGVTTLSMDLWLDDVTDLLIDWRDWRFQPYEVGPTLGIREGRAWMGSSLLTSVPSHQWISVRMHTGLGAQYTGQWLLSLKISGEAEQTWTLPHETAGFRHLTWLGVISMSATNSMFHIDNLSLRSEP